MAFGSLASKAKGAVNKAKEMHENVDKKIRGIEAEAENVTTEGEAPGETKGALRDELDNEKAVMNQLEHYEETLINALKFEEQEIEELMQQHNKSKKLEARVEEQVNNIAGVWFQEVYDRSQQDHVEQGAHELLEEARQRLNQKVQEKKQSDATKWRVSSSNIATQFHLKKLTDISGNSINDAEKAVEAANEHLSIDQNLEQEFEEFQSEWEHTLQLAEAFAGDLQKWETSEEMLRQMAEKISARDEAAEFETVLQNLGGQEYQTLLGGLTGSTPEGGKGIEPIIDTIEQELRGLEEDIENTVGPQEDVKAKAERIKQGLEGAEQDVERLREVLVSRNVSGLKIEFRDPDVVGSVEQKIEQIEEMIEKVRNACDKLIQVEEQDEQVEQQIESEIEHEVSAGEQAESDIEDALS